MITLKYSISKLWDVGTISDCMNILPEITPTTMHAVSTLFQGRMTQFTYRTIDPKSWDFQVASTSLCLVSRSNPQGRAT